MGWFLRGGFMMWPLLLLSIVTLTVVLERARFFLAQRELPPRAALENALRRLGLGERDALSLEAAVIAEQRRLERGLFLLDTAITAAPLMGILGTVLGIIESFGLIAGVSAADPLAFSGGVAKALITTAAGLVIALLALFPFNWFRARIDFRLEQLERESNRMLGSQP